LHWDRYWQWLIFAMQRQDANALSTRAMPIATAIANAIPTAAGFSKARPVPAAVFTEIGRRARFDDGRDAPSGWYPPTAGSINPVCAAVFGGCASAAARRPSYATGPNLADRYGLRRVHQADSPADQTAYDERLAIDDVRDACDLFLPRRQESMNDDVGIDGCVSLEVSRHLAHDTDATIAEAST
jgi:hypothetical protein